MVGTETRRNVIGLLLSSASIAPASGAAERHFRPDEGETLQDLWDEWRRLEDLAEVDNSDDETHEALWDSSGRALDRLVNAPVSTLRDVLLKLQLIDEHEEYTKLLARNPNEWLVEARVIVGMIRDLQAICAR